MRTHHRIATAAVLVLTLSLPAGAAGRPPRQPGGIVQAVKRFVLRAMTRISPPVGSPSTSELPTTTTEGPTKTQMQ
ncbi:MAG TPA: hypothetical protein VF432_30580 [Thermoanaerobaculia bacterium]